MGSANITPDKSCIRITANMSEKSSPRRGGKICDLEQVLRSDRTSSAFLKYLDGKSNGHFLTLYLDIMQYKRTKNDKLLQQSLKDVRSNWDSNLTRDDAPSSPQQGMYDLVTEVLLAQAVSSSDVKRLEDVCVSHLSEELEYFFVSHEQSTRRNHSQKFEWSHGNGYGAVNNELRNKFKNVLIIDDSSRNSRLMSNQLKAHGHSVRQANHGWIGTHIARSHHFDVILVDLSMNTMDPYEVIRRINAISAKCNSSTLIAGLNYSEYDCKLQDNLFFTINVEKLEMAPKDFISGFYKAIIRFADVSCDNHETCSISLPSSKVSV